MAIIARNEKFANFCLSHILHILYLLQRKHKAHRIWQILLESSDTQFSDSIGGKLMSTNLKRYTCMCINHAFQKHDGNNVKQKGET